MKILFIAMSESIHTARWINQIKNNGWKLYLFPSQITNNVNSKIDHVEICIPAFLKDRKTYLSRIVFKIYNVLNQKINPYYYEKLLAKYIKKIKPDIIHTLETQAAGYLVYSTKEKYFKNSLFPSWWHTNWGSDIYLFGRLKKHKDKIKEVIGTCDYYSCECNRDLLLAKSFGFSKIAFPVYPNTGGFDIDKLIECKKDILKTSKRKIIMLKGYQGWAGRALVGIRALSLIKDYLSGYELFIFSCGEDSVEIAAELFECESKIKASIIPPGTSHEGMLKFHGKARISIGLSISDSISTSVLEAMAMGSFPIQSWTSAADEWIKDGESGILVPPEDPDQIAKAIIIALSDDDLVDKAAEKNWETVRKRLDYNDLKQKTINSYNQIFSDRKNKN